MGSSLDVDALRNRYGLTPYGASTNSDYYGLADEAVVVIPREGSKDDGATARSNREKQIAYFRERGQKGGAIIFFDRMTSQDKDARKVYETMDVALTCTALVGGSMLTRAMFSFFLGISRPKVPIKLFADLDGAVAWVRQVNRSTDRALRGEAA
jgi:hypothetical protein